ncbi:hypothetical protein HaLaN_22770, partial [Haematococcus lacustris]
MQPDGAQAVVSIIGYSPRCWPPHRRLLSWNEDVSFRSQPLHTASTPPLRRGAAPKPEAAASACRSSKSPCNPSTAPMRDCSTSRSLCTSACRS